MILLATRVAQPRAVQDALNSTCACCSSRRRSSGSTQVAGGGVPGPGSASGAPQSGAGAGTPTSTPAEPPTGTSSSSENLREEVVQEGVLVVPQRSHAALTKDGRGRGGAHDDPGAERRGAPPDPPPRPVRHGQPRLDVAERCGRRWWSAGPTPGAGPGGVGGRSTCVRHSRCADARKAAHRGATAATAVSASHQTADSVFATRGHPRKCEP